ncbi:MAG TPA: DAK2 domain-containing protein [Acidimicrobiales bacterium]|nr:DAK2 domain-containing protein [Acidimicrobiales bacterium]
MEPLAGLSATDLAEAICRFRDGLRSHQEAINRLNVYPVPDGDTGTNMSLTLESVVEEVAGVDRNDMAAVCKALSHGSLMGARGNSGVILSQVLRGLADGLAGSPSVGPVQLAEALCSASAAAYRAVMRPVEGTILTVVRESADAARAAAEEGANLVEVLDAARATGSATLARTPDMLAALKQAGVVDAGGAGLLLLYDGLLAVVDGRPLPEPPTVHGPDVTRRGAGDAAHGGEGDISGLRYEVMYLLEAPDETIPGFKDVWAGVGDSIVVVGGDGVWNCHIHTDDIGAAIEAALDCGRPRRIRVTDLLEQVEEERWVREAGDGEAAHQWVGNPPVTAVVAVANGGGVRRIFRSLGVHQVVAGGQSMNPSTAQILEAVEVVPADQVVVLPNNKNIVPVAEQVAAVAAKKVKVVPTSGVAEGFAALLAYDPQAPVDANTQAMTEAAGRVLSAEVTQAVRDSDGPSGPINRGDWLGITREGIEVVAPSLEEATVCLLDKLVSEEHEIVTIIEGEGSGAAETRRLTEWLSANRPLVTAEVHHGGQPLYPYLFSIE